MPEGSTAETLTAGSMLGDRVIVGMAEYYDADHSNKYTHVLLDDMSTLSLQGAAKCAGWIQPVPEKFQSQIGQYLAGYADNLPIAGRGSQGPSLYGWSGDVNDMATNPIITYDLNNRLADDPYNNNDGDRHIPPVSVGTNDLWTVNSSANCGFIVGDKYIVVGSTEGIESGLGYKIIQKGATQPAFGPAPYDPEDVQNSYWVYDLPTVLSLDEPHQARPEAYGKLNLPVDGLIRGAFYDGEYLYLAATNADTLQSRYDSYPVILRYKVEA
jgi:hypothetical protein